MLGPRAVHELSTRQRGLAEQLFDAQLVDCLNITCCPVPNSRADIVAGYLAAQLLVLAITGCNNGLGTVSRTVLRGTKWYIRGNVARLLLIVNG